MNTRHLVSGDRKVRSITIFDNDITDRSFLVTCRLCFGVNKLTHSVFDKTGVSIFVWELILVSHEILTWFDGEHCKLTLNWLTLHINLIKLVLFSYPPLDKLEATTNIEFWDTLESYSWRISAPSHKQTCNNCTDQQNYWWTNKGVSWIAIHQQ